MSDREHTTDRGASSGRAPVRRRGHMRPLILSIAITIVAVTMASADPFADRVVTYTGGTGGGSGQAALPGIVLGPPRGGGAFQGPSDTLPLGLGGSCQHALIDHGRRQRP